jgi:hypothetical protein
MPRIDNTQNWMPKRCNSSATAGSARPAPRPGTPLNTGHIDAFNNGYEGCLTATTVDADATLVDYVRRETLTTEQRDCHFG